MAFKAAAVAPIAHPAFTTAAAPTSPIDLADGAAQAVPAQAVAESPLLAIKEGCGLGDQNAADGQHVQPVSAGDASQATPAGAALAQAALAQAAAASPPPAIKEGCSLGLGDPDPDISGSVRQHAQPISVDLEKPRTTATVDDLAFFMLAAVFFFGLPALVYWSLGGSSLLATAGGSLHAAAERLGGAVLIAQPVAVGVALAQRYQPRMPWVRRGTLLSDGDLGLLCLLRDPVLC